jgi:hypothetical protein
MDEKWVTTGGLQPTKLVVVFQVERPSTTTTCNFIAESVNNGNKEFAKSADRESRVNAAGRTRSMKKADGNRHVRLRVVLRPKEANFESLPHQ